MESINSTVKKSNRLNKEEISCLAVRYQNATDKVERDDIFTNLWMAIKQYVISVLSNTFPTYYSRYYEEMLQQAAEYIFVELPKYDAEKGAFITFIKPTVIHAGQNYINEFIHGTSAHYGAAIAKIKKARNAMLAQGVC